MKKLICNIGSLALGVLASIMAFIPMFDIKVTSGSFSMFAEKPFSVFNCPYIGEDGFKDTFRLITMILAIIAIVAFVVVAITVVLNFLNNKNSKIATIKKIASLVLIFVAILFVSSAIVFMLQNVLEESIMKASISISNWFAFLSVPVGFIGSGILAMCAKD